MSSYFYFYGIDAQDKANAFSKERIEFHPETFIQPGRVVVRLSR